jgi:hypothetical protein
MAMITRTIKGSMVLLLLAGTAQAQNVKFENAPSLSPNTTEEMQHPGFWISRIKGNPDRVIMTPAQITELNKKNRTKSYTFTDINGKTYALLSGRSYLTDDPLSMKTFPGDSLRTLLQNARQTLEKGTFYDFRKKKYDDEMKKKLIDNMQADSIPEMVIPKYGILVAPSHNMKYPTANEAWTEPNGWITNFSVSSLDAASPVAVLHTSRDGEWLYVRSDIHFGWVPALHVATGSLKELRVFADAKNFVVATTGKVSVYSRSEPGVFLMDMYMGAKVPLVKKAGDGYHVLVPFRMPDGSFKAAPGRIRPDAGVSVGYQPFTQRNVITTFFSKLNDPWSGGDYYEGRHCCGTMRGVLRTFGIITLNSTTFQLHASDHVFSFPKETPKEVKYSYLAKCEPGITLLGSPAHVILYLGEADGRQYVIHSTGYDYKRDDGTVLLLRRVNVNDTELEGGSQVDTWTYMCEMKP